jgi:iron complex outermembrane receptor protein
MKIFALLFVMLISGAVVKAQTVSGTIKDDAGKAASASTVALLRAKDSSTVKFATTKADGRFQFDNVAAGNYLISASHVGYAPKISGKVTVETADITVPDVKLVKASSELAGVTVTSKKPIVEVRADKTVLNVEGTINAQGNDALELLRKSPGVMVDKDDNLSLAGKNGVQVFIDGKPSPLSGSDLANYLKSIQSSQIESIELITNPSAKYEAAGNAGIINIKFKKNKSLGTNGSVNAGYGIGTYGKYNGGLSLNHRDAKVNIFGTYNYNTALNKSNFISDREQADSLFNQSNVIKNYNNGSHTYKAGLDYFVNKASTVGVMINGGFSDFDTKTAGPMYITYKPTNTLNRILYATGDNKNKRDNMNFNLNYRYAVASGKELNIDADYGFFNLRGNQYQPNTYYDPTGTVILNQNIYRTISPTDIDLYSVKTDYEQNFKKGKLGIGGKVSYVSTANDFSRYNVIGGADVFDKDRSNTFHYKENINALYLNYNRSFKNFILQAGVRAENTNSKGRSNGLRYNAVTTQYENYDSSVNRNYTDFFPSAAITFNKNPKSQIGFTYSRRIDRPAYQDLNPFEFKINDYTFMKGNTQLRPQYTNSFGITHTYMYKLTTQLNYSHVKDIFTQLPDTTEKSKAFLTKKNLANQDIVSLNISYPFSYKWYSLFTNVNTYYSMYKADFGGGNRKVNLDVFAVNVYVQNSFRLGKGYTAELSGFFNSPTIWQGIFKSISMYSVDGGLQKTLWKGKANVKVAVSDIFHTMKWKGSSNFSGQISTASGRWESQQFKLNFSYRFGNNQVKAARQRKTSIEDENKRLNGSGGTPGQ